MPSLEQRLAAGLEAFDWIETSSRGSWRRFAKFGRGAMYVWIADKAPALWFSDIAEMEPKFPVVGPHLDQILAAGDKWIKLDQEAAGVDTTALLVELLDLPDQGNRSQKNDE
jgi:hypothetical protein